MKILIAGNWHSLLHEEPVYRAFEKLGHKPLRFRWHLYFKPTNSLQRIFTPFFKAQNKYGLGPIINRVNRDLIDMVKHELPDIVFIYRGILIYKETLQRIKEVAPATVLLGYNNDDPFSTIYPKWQWRHFLAGVPEYDLVLAYRLHNLNEFNAAGAKQVELMRSWFVPELNYPVILSEEDRNRYECDVVFVGHYENDGRIKYLEEIVHRGWDLRIFGHDYGWHPSILRSELLKKYYPLCTVWGSDYNKALCGAKVALCFFSKLNRDTYTRRCFEIPASGTLLLSEYSDDLAGLFKRGVEADYFRNIKELIDKLEMYLVNEELRKRVARAGMEKVNSAGHDVKSRMEQLLKWVADVRKD